MLNGEMDIKGLGSSSWRY